MADTTNNKKNNAIQRITNRRQLGNKKQNGDLSNFVFGKVPPQALPLEEAVLGALMIDKDAIAIVIDILRPESFYLDAHQLIYKAMMCLFEKSQPIDLLTATEELRKLGYMEGIGGPYYLVELTNRVASSANIEYHARIIAQKHIQRELIRISTKVINDAFEETTDVFQLLDDAEQGLFNITQQNLSRGYESMGTLASKAIKQLEELAAKQEGLTGVPTGFTELDRLTSGWQPSDLVIIAARPGMGKTSFVLSLAKNAAMEFEKPVAIFSLEMSSIQLVQRLIAMEVEIPITKMRNGQLVDYEWQQLNSMIEKMSDVPIYIDDTPGINIFELRAKCRRLKMQYDIQMVIIDYLQLMSGGGDNKRGNREQEISAISRALKGLAKELEVPVLALSQLSRAVEVRGGAKRPQLSDLRECITGDTLIYMANSGSYQRVDELVGQNGFQVLALDKNYQIQKAECLDVWATGEKDIFEVTTQSGYKIRTSLNHPFLTIGGWQQLVDIKEGDYVATAKHLGKAKGHTERTFQAAIGTQYCGTALYKSNISRQRLERIASVLESEELEQIANSDVKWEKIVSIEHIGREMTYDIHVADYHNFVANDFIIHNSGAIEQDADIVSFIYRPEYYQIMEDEEGQSLKGIAEVIISKNRHGSLKTVKLKFIGEFTKFANLDDPNFDALPEDAIQSPVPNIITRPSKMNDDLTEDIPF